MVDNVKVDPGTGGGSPLVAADDIGGGVVVQRVKLMLGADGANDGDVSSANPIPVTLGAGAATAAKQDTGNTSIGNVDTNLGAKADAAATTDAGAFSLIALFKRLLGKITAVDTGNVTVAASALPAGAATGAKQDTGNVSLASIDGKITAVNTGAVTVAASALPAGASTGAKQDTGNVSLASIDGKITAVNTGAVTVAASALPAGASTGAKQDTGNVSLASIDGKIPAAPATAGNQATEIASLASIDTKMPAAPATAANQAAEVASLAALVAGIIVTDLPVMFREALMSAMNRQVASEQNGGRLRVVLDAGPGAQTLANVTTVATVTALTNCSNLVAIGPASAGVPIRDALVTPTERGAWANTVRARIT